MMHITTPGSGGLILGAFDHGPTGNVDFICAFFFRTTTSLFSHRDHRQVICP